jgi:hypothetical protein
VAEAVCGRDRVEMALKEVGSAQHAGHHFERREVEVRAALTPLTQDSVYTIFPVVLIVRVVLSHVDGTLL